MPNAGADNNTDKCRAQLVAIYEKYNPDKIGMVDKLLKGHKGREQELIHKLEDKYRSAVTQNVAQLPTEVQQMEGEIPDTPADTPPPPEDELQRNQSDTDYTNDLGLHSSKHISFKVPDETNEAQVTDDAKNNETKAAEPEPRLGVSEEQLEEECVDQEFANDQDAKEDIAHIIADEPVDAAASCEVKHNNDLDAKQEVEEAEVVEQQAEEEEEVAEEEVEEEEEVEIEEEKAEADEVEEEGSTVAVEHDTPQEDLAVDDLDGSKEEFFFEGAMEDTPAEPIEEALQLTTDSEALVKPAGVLLHSCMLGQ